MKRDGSESFSKLGNLLVASACKVKSAHIKETLAAVVSLFHVINFDMLKIQLVKLEPETLLLDYDLPLLNGVCGISELRKLCPDTNIVIFHNFASEEEEWAMFKAGVRGCCPDIKSSPLKQMVFAVSNGELWIRREFLRRLLEQLVEIQGKEQAKTIEFHSDTHRLLDQLTRREYEIAVRVANGESNKQIAYSLKITERTVKAHLTSVFDKLGVADRLNVALIVSAEQRQKLNVAHVSKRPSVVHLAVPGV